MRYAFESADEVGHRPLTGAHEHPLSPERRQQAGAEERGLAAAGRPDDREQRRVREPSHELVDEPLAAEEELRVGRLERR